MLKKLSLLALSVGALIALAAPTVSQAASLEYGDQGEKMKASMIIAAESHDLRFPITPTASLGCETVRLDGELIGSGRVITDIEGTGTFEKCSLNNWSPVVIDPSAFHISLNENNMELVFTYYAPGWSGSGPCIGSNSTIEASYGLGSDIISIYGAGITAQGSECLGFPAIVGSFNLVDPEDGDSPVFFVEEEEE